MFRRLFEKKEGAPKAPSNSVRAIVYDINGVLDFSGSNQDVLCERRSTGRPNEALLKKVKEFQEQGIKQFVATNMIEGTANNFYYKYKSFFDGLFTQDHPDLGQEKEKKGYFEALLMLLKKEIPDLEAGEILFIDNEDCNIECAQRAGWQVKCYMTKDQGEKSLQELFSRYTLVPTKGTERDVT